MSILRVANVQFNASGTRRIDYDATADDGIIKISADAIKLPVGDSVSRPNSQAGMIRYNSDTGYMEFGGATNWVAVASNVAFDIANAAYTMANVAYNAQNVDYTLSNTAFGVANAAFSKANSALPNTTNAVFQGNLTITGALTIGQNTVVITETSVNVANAVIISSQGLTVPRGNTSQRPAGVALGTIRYNTDTTALENYTPSGWLKVSIPIPGIASVSGYIYNSVTSTLTLTGSGFGSAAGNVTFTSGATTATVSATPTNDASLSVIVPSTIYNLSVGTSVSIKYTNADGGISGTTTTNIISLPTGGTITTSGGYRYHTFTSSGSFVVPNTAITSIDATIVAGGGGGGRNRGGGGGAGGMVTYNSIGNVSTGTYTVTIGGGGIGQTSSIDSTQGSLTSFIGGAISWSVAGGGRGAGNGVGSSFGGGNGGSGGGAGSAAGYSGGSGTAGQGNAGGSTGSYNNGGGGGGKASAGGAATGSNVLAAGGSGEAGINGTTYAAGGAGGANSDAVGGGGSGATNTGNGGAGGSGNVDGGAGGSGIFVLRYLLP